jgi:hypothetical protein
MADAFLADRQIENPDVMRCDPEWSRSFASMA